MNANSESHRKAPHCTPPVEGKKAILINGTSPAEVIECYSSAEQDYSMWLVIPFSEETYSYLCGMTPVEQWNSLSLTKEPTKKLFVSFYVNTLYGKGIYTDILQWGFDKIFFRDLDVIEKVLIARHCENNPSGFKLISFHLFEQ